MTTDSRCVSDPPGPARPRRAGRAGQAWTGGRRGARAVVQHVLIEPVEEGRLRDVDWPEGLRPPVLIGVAITVIMVLLTGLSGVLRTHTELIFLPPRLTLPFLALPIVAAAVIFAIVALYVAALHVRVLVRIPLLLLVCSIVIRPAAAEDFSATSLPLLVGAIGLVIFAALRWRRPFRAFEVPIACVLVGASICYALALENQIYGGGLRSISLNTFVLMTVTLAILAGPFITLAGATVTELLASTCNAVASAAGQAAAKATRPRPLLLAGLVLLSVGRLAQIVWQIGHNEDYRLTGLALGSLPLLLPLAAVALLLRHRGVAGRIRPWDPKTGLDDWRRWALLAASLVAFNALWSALAADLARSAGLDGVGRWLSGLDLQLTLAITVPVTAVVLIVVAVAAYRRSGRIPLLLLMLAWLVAVRVAFTVIGTFGTIEGVLVSAGVVVILLFVMQAVRGRLGVDSAVSIGSVLLLSGLYEYRAVLTEPLTAALALAGGTVGLMVGVIWRLLTDNAFAIGDSVLFPRPSRVLLIIANAVFGSSAIALLALQGGVTDTNLGLLESLGDSQLGFSLVVTVLLLQLLTAIFGPPRRMTAKSATETDTNGQPAAIEPATMPDILADHTGLG